MSGEVNPSPGPVLSLSLPPAEAAVRVPSRDQDKGPYPPRALQCCLQGKSTARRLKSVTSFDVRTWPGFLAHDSSIQLELWVTNWALKLLIQLHVQSSCIFCSILSFLGFGKAKRLRRRRSRNYDELFPAGLLVIVAGIKSSSRLQIFPCQALSLSPDLLSLSGFLFTRFS